MTVNAGRSTLFREILIIMMLVAGVLVGLGRMIDRVERFRRLSAATSLACPNNFHNARELCTNPRYERIVLTMSASISESECGPPV